jgi:antitoxin MazE
LLQFFYNVETFKVNTSMQAVIRKWGNSPALRLPSAVLKEAGYEIAQKLELHVTRGRIVIQPSEKLEYDLDALVMGMNAKNKHDEASFGAPIFAAP